MRDLIILYDEDLERAKIPINMTSFILPKVLLKRLFCRHTYKYSCNGIITRTETDFSGDGSYNSWQEYYTEYVCTKCGKRKKIFKNLL